jgi:ribosomal-protein-alanine N-acetyltransferase
VSSTIGQVSIARMTQDEAEAIADWRYEPPYDFYDWRADEDDLAELLDPARRGDCYFSAHDAAGELIGYFGFRCTSDVVGVGIGLRPDLTDRGLGLGFLEQGLVFANARFQPRRFKLSVAEFNERAIKVYERAGFARTRSFVHETNGGFFPFVEMERPA